MDHMESALKIVEAQAGVRPMTTDEISEMVRKLRNDLVSMEEGEREPEVQQPPVDPKRAIKLKKIICLECGQSYKTLSRKHLAKHGLTPDEYRGKWGYPKRFPLSCRETTKARSERMKEMKLWTRTGKDKPEKTKPAKAATKSPKAE
ncbi:MAG: MucR family transcriptional regulator [Syntrophotalea acetylenica]|nr:MucR family transcriptional regulator [Syntrophotalea acetylenica]